MLGHLLLAMATCLPVEGDRIRIRDLASAIPAFAGVDEEESIAFAPAPGVRRRFSAGELSRLAARKHLATAVEPVCFERRLAPLARDQVLAALRRSLPEDAELELADYSDAPVPAGRIEFLRAGLARARAGSPREPVFWRGRVTYATAQSVSVWAKVRVWISRPAIVAVEDLAAGQPIAAGQVRPASVDMAPFLEATPASIEDILGMTARRLVRAGKTLSRSDIVAPVEVTRGDMVGVEARVGAASLKFEVRAEASGRTGDLVPVRNVESGKTFRARVMRKGWVAVEKIQ